MKYATIPIFAHSHTHTHTNTHTHTYTHTHTHTTLCTQTFRIPEQSIHVPFLLVGHVAEPRVSFDRPAVNFGKCLVAGARGHVLFSIVNAEDMPFTVRFLL